MLNKIEKAAELLADDTEFCKKFLAVFNNPKTVWSDSLQVERVRTALRIAVREK
jgi:hypothetical protein